MNSPQDQRLLRSVSFDLPESSIGGTCPPNAESIPEDIDELNGQYAEGVYIWGEYHYDCDSGEVEIAPDFPVMEPISHNFDDLHFLDEAEPGDGRLQIVNPDGSEFIIENLNSAIIERTCTSLARSFVPFAGRKVFTLHFPQTPVIGLLRAIYQGDYTFCEAMLERTVPLLLHFQILYLAIKFRSDDVAILARSYAMKDIENAGHAGHLPLLDLCESIRFLYTDLRHCHDLRRSIANYCLQHFQEHNGEMFRQTAYESPAFHRDLQHANFVDDFQESHAAEITRLPVCQHWTHHDDMPAWKGTNDFTCQFHSTEVDNLYNRRSLLANLSAGSFMQANDAPLMPSNLGPASTVSPLVYRDHQPDRGREVSRVESQNLVFRTATPWLPEEEQAVNAAIMPRISHHQGTLDEEYIRLGKREPSRSNLPDIFGKAASSPSDTCFVQRDTAPTSSAKSNDANNNSASLSEHSPTAESSDSEWTLIDPAEISGIFQGQNNAENGSMSDSEWSEIESLL